MVDELKNDSALQDYNDIFTAQGIKIAQGSLSKMKGKDPKSISDMLLAIITRVESEGKKNGVQFPLEAIFTAGKDVASFVLDKLGIQDEPTIKQVVGTVVGKYLMAKRNSGDLTDQQIQQMAQQQPEPQQQPQGGIPNGQNG